MGDTKMDIRPDFSKWKKIREKALIIFGILLIPLLILLGILMNGIPEGESRPDALYSDKELSQYYLKAFTTNLIYNHRIADFGGELTIETTSQDELIVFNRDLGPIGGIPIERKKSTGYIAHLLEGDDYAAVVLVREDQNRGIDFSKSSIRINNDFRGLRDDITGYLEYYSMENKNALDELRNLGKPIYVFVFPQPDSNLRIPLSWFIPISIGILMVIVFLFYKITNRRRVIRKSRGTVHPLC